MQIGPETNPNPAPSFQPGDPVMVLYQGRYTGMEATFAGPAADPSWAYVRENNGEIRAHPIAWMRSR